MQELTLHNLFLTENRSIGAGLFAARDLGGQLRIHDGEFFRGYLVTGYRNRQNRQAFGFAVWNHKGRHYRTNAKYKTMRGAERAMVSRAVALVHG